MRKFSRSKLEKLVATAEKKAIKSGSSRVGGPELEASSHPEENRKDRC